MDRAALLANFLRKASRMTVAEIQRELALASDRGLIYLNGFGAIVTESIMERECPLLWANRSTLYPIIEDSIMENEEDEEVIDWPRVERELYGALHAVRLSDLESLG